MRGGAGSAAKGDVCETCPYWKHQPGQAQTRPASKALAGVKPSSVETGLCYYSRHNWIVGNRIEVNPLDPTGRPQQTEFRERSFPLYAADEFCADHPERAAKREYVHELARRRAAATADSHRDPVFDPAKHGDASGGFDRAPSLDEARRLAVVAQGNELKDPAK